MTGTLANASGPGAADKHEREKDKGPRGYMPNWRKRTPFLTTEQTRIPINIPRREQSVGSFDRKVVQDALDGWAAAGSAANVAMQLGWPEVAYGVMESRVESGALMKHPWKRLRTTDQYLGVAVLGTDAEREAFRQAVDSAHRMVRSTDESPVKYNAFNRELQLWVAACLYIGFEDTHQLLFGPMTEKEADEFFASARPLATTLQVTEDMWPSSRKEFDQFWNLACERISFDDTQKQFIDDLINLKMITPILALPLRGLLRFLTLGFLGPYFREQLGYKWTKKDQRRFDNLFLFVGFVNRFLPQPLRFGAFHLLMRDLRWRMGKDKPLI